MTPARQVAMDRLASLAGEVAVPPQAFADLLLQVCGIEKTPDSPVLRMELTMEGGLVMVTVTRWLKEPVSAPASGTAHALLQRMRYEVTPFGKPDEWRVNAAGEVCPRWADSATPDRPGDRR